MTSCSSSSDPRPRAQTRPRRARPRPDAVCVAAVDAALAAVHEVAGETVGDHLGVQAEDDRVVTHLFAAQLPGYVGWHWSVTVARIPRSRNVTVSEVTMLPGEGALLAPEWVPWSERLRPGDLGIGDLLPTAPDDDRLAPGYLLSDDPAVADREPELGLGRLRVMSRPGREETAGRWYASAAGPESPLAQAAPAHCGSCGFYLPLAGSLGGLFGACGNLFAPDDGRVVSADHGCGAHSQALVESVPSTTIEPMVVDDTAVEVVAPHTPGSVADAAESVPFGHG